MKFATGKFAIGICQRCGGKAKYTDLVDDGQYPNLRVHVWCRDIKHPVERPFVAEDGVALKKPAPDLDRANDPAASSATLAAALLPLDGGSYFGGAT